MWIEFTWKLWKCIANERSFRWRSLFDSIYVSQCTYLFGFVQFFRTINVSDGLRSVFTRLAPFGETKFIVTLQEMFWKFSHDHCTQIKYVQVWTQNIYIYINIFGRILRVFENTTRALARGHAIVPRLQQSFHWIMYIS